MSYIIPVTIIVFNCFFGAAGAFLLKKGIKKSLFNLDLFWGVFFYGLGSAIFIIVLRFAPVSVLYPITASTYIWSFFLARRYLKEQITNYKIAGLLFIIIGIICITLS